ncbi:MAG: TetR-family transcriptional regulator [Sphingomonadales bacterium]|nr:TetR-family transcriptional regulator [Sphingomonadales bacterium]
MGKTIAVPTVELLDMRDKILDAALQTFAERGFEGATLTLIANRSGSTTPLIVYHFKNKLELWRAVVTTFTGRHMEAVNNVLDAPDLSAGARLSRFIERNMELLAARPELHRLIVSDSYQPSERLTWLVNSLIKPYYGRMVSLIEEAQAEGSVRKLDVGRLRYAILGVLSLPAIAAEYELLTGADPRSPREVKASIRFLKDLIFLD